MNLVKGRETGKPFHSCLSIPAIIFLPLMALGYVCRTTEFTMNQCQMEGVRTNDFFIEFWDSKANPIEKSHQNQRSWRADVAGLW